MILRGCFFFFFNFPLFLPFPDILIGGSQKGGFQRVVLADVLWTPTGTRVQKKERQYQKSEQGYKKRNNGTKNWNKGTFAKTALLQNRPVSWTEKVPQRTLAIKIAELSGELSGLICLKLGSALELFRKFFGTVHAILWLWGSFLVRDFCFLLIMFHGFLATEPDVLWCIGGPQSIVDPVGSFCKMAAAPRASVRLHMRH